MKTESTRGLHYDFQLMLSGATMTVCLLYTLKTALVIHMGKQIKARILHINLCCYNMSGLLYMRYSIKEARY